jgi:hypothetical protein
MTFYLESLSIETLPTLLYSQITYPNTNIINLDISSNKLVTSRKIYRTKSDSTDIYYLLTVINDNITTEFADTIIDSELTDIYNNIYNNDSILGNIIDYNYLNITSPINTNLINKPCNIGLIEVKNQNDKLGGKYQYIFTYYNSSTLKEKIIDLIITFFLFLSNKC